MKNKFNIFLQILLVLIFMLGAILIQDIQIKDSIKLKLLQYDEKYLNGFIRIKSSWILKQKQDHLPQTNNYKGDYNWLDETPFLAIAHRM